MTNQRISCFRFDDIRVDPGNFKVFKADENLPLEPKTLLLLTFLLENRDRLVEKRELLDAIWKDVAVTENALTREIGKLRRSLGDDPKAAKYIQTVHTRGYRFIAAVQVLDAASAEPVAEERGGDGKDVDAAVSTTEFSKPHRYIFFAALGVAAMLAAGAFLMRKPAEGTKAPIAKHRVTTLAVLPFRSLGADTYDKDAGLGIADALITKLSNSAQLTVEPVSTVLHYVDPKQDSLAIGRAMGVDYVLEGKFQKLGDRVRVTVQLLCIACNGQSRWAASFDETSGDLFQVQDSISQKVVAALPLELRADEQMRLAKRETRDTRAQFALSKGRLFLTEDNKESLEKSIEYEQLAVTLDPGYAQAWALLSDSYRRREWYGGSPVDFLPLAKNAAAKARSLDDSVPYTHSMLGLIAFQYDWDFKKAEREYARARQLQASWAHQWYARYLLAMNRPLEAESEYRRFRSAVPFSASGSVNFAQFLFLTREYPRALEQVRGTLGMQPDYAPAHELLGLVYEQQGLADQATREFQKAIDLSHGYIGLASLGHLYATAGKRAGVESVRQNLEAQRKQRYVAPFERALIDAGMRDNAESLRELEEAYAERSLSAQSLLFDPRLSEVRKEPRYREFIKRIGLQ